MARPPASQQRILDGARRTLDQYGWQRTTADRIATEAGVSRVTLHRRGLTKEAILEQLAEQAIERYQKAMWPVLTAPERASERLDRALGTLCELAEENMSLLLALDAEANASVFHDHGGPEVLTRNVFTEPLERVLRDGVADGSVRAPEDPAEAATVLFNLVGWTYIHLRSGHHWSPERAQRATLDAALRGVLTAE